MEVSFAGNTGGQILATRTSEKEARKDRGTIVARTTERTTVTKLDLALSAQVKINGRVETIYSPAIRFDIVQGYSIEPAAEVTSIQPGGAAELAGVLRREPEFTSAVHLEAQNASRWISTRRRMNFACPAKPRKPQRRGNTKLNSSPVRRWPDLARRAFRTPSGRSKCGWR